jgi:limonene-1,2-epoxide hydrolase
MKSPNVETVEKYLNALKAKDVSAMPLASDVIFEDPLTATLTGPEALHEFFATAFTILNDVHIERHISEGEYVATEWVAETTVGRIPIFEWFRVVDGQIKHIKVYLDPRPITNPQG